ncbi:hypothetical protein [Lishizhenia sp.]|uniref:hypothetical protein n=1 Tax=Lishizhenia sp. TaxID=2497594 RepID=UPI00299D351D|nr:hypothetical protein [Lishizhenia sp.]MDX1447195.1 hypothetical protein [Lishizhenia sp.]
MKNLKIKPLKHLKLKLENTNNGEAIFQIRFTTALTLWVLLTALASGKINLEKFISLANIILENV